MMPPQVTLYPRYNPSSQTLRGPFWTTGLVAERVTSIDSHRCRINAGKPACFGESIPPGIAQWFDLGIRPQSGDTVMVWADGQQICKRWVDVSGEIFLVCHWFCAPLSWIPGVRAVGVLVAECSFPGWQPTHIAHQVVDAEGGEDDAQWRRELNSKPKVREALGWMLKHGIPRAA
jgi:hypothetical protein